MAKLLTSHLVSTYVNEAQEFGAGCDDGCGDACDVCIWGSAFDALCDIEARGARVTRETVEPLFGAPFTRLTAFIKGKAVASVSRPWDIAEGLWDLLADVKEAQAANDDDAGAMFVDGVLVARVTHVTI
jgi:hypothetical protein